VACRSIRTRHFPVMCAPYALARVRLGCLHDCVSLLASCHAQTGRSVGGSSSAVPYRHAWNTGLCGPPTVLTFRPGRIGSCSGAAPRDVSALLTPLARAAEQLTETFLRCQPPLAGLRPPRCSLHTSSAWYTCFSPTDSQYPCVVPSCWCLELSSSTGTLGARLL